jgi:predicted alpha/beta superfamily hydrolase
LNGDSPNRDVFVYLPPCYASSTERYPVVYLLHGYGLQAERIAQHVFPFFSKNLATD